LEAQNKANKEIFVASNHYAIPDIEFCTASGGVWASDLL